MVFKSPSSITKKIKKNLINMINEKKERQVILDKSPTTKGAVHNSNIIEVLELILEKEVYKAYPYFMLKECLEEINPEDD